jgi:Planctomycete cytochrome C
VVTIALLQTIKSTVPRGSLPNARQLIASFLKPPEGKEGTSIVRASNAPSSAAVTFDFARDIQPVFERSCVNCHSGARPKGGLNLTTREGLLKGGQSGRPAIIPGYADESPLVHQVSDKVEDLEIPPLAPREKYPALAPAKIERVRAWIEAGAP